HLDRCCHHFGPSHPCDIHGKMVATPSDVSRISRSSLHEGSQLSVHSGDYRQFGFGSSKYASEAELAHWETSIRVLSCNYGQRYLGWSSAGAGAATWCGRRSCPV